MRKGRNLDESSGRKDEEQRMTKLRRNPEESHDRAGQLVGCEDGNKQPKT